jgi:hypothetical protein
MRRSIFPVLPAALAAALFAVREARAGITVSAEMDAAQGIELPSPNMGARPGYGLGGTLGYRIGIGPIFVQPEAQGSYFAFPAGTGGIQTRMLRLMGGGRIGLSGRFQPTLFAHAGGAWLDTYTSGRSMAAGFAMGFKLLPVLIVGAQAAYNVVSVSGTLGTPRWVSYGAHVAVDF